MHTHVYTHTYTHTCIQTLTRVHTTHSHVHTHTHTHSTVLLLCMVGGTRNRGGYSVNRAGTRSVAHAKCMVSYTVPHVYSSLSLYMEDTCIESARPPMEESYRKWYVILSYPVQ